MSEKLPSEEVFNEEEKDWIGEVFNELDMRRESLVRHGMSSSNGEQGTLTISSSDVIYRYPDGHPSSESYSEVWGRKPNLLDTTVLTFMFYLSEDEQYDELEDAYNSAKLNFDEKNAGIYDADEEKNTVPDADDTPLDSTTEEEHFIDGDFTYDIISSFSIPTDAQHIPQKHHDAIRSALFLQFDAETYEELNDNAKRFVDMVMSSDMDGDQVLYQEITTTYTICPAESDIHQTISLRYHVAFEEAVIATIYGESYESGTLDKSLEQVHDTHLDNLSAEYVTHRPSVPNHEVNDDFSQAEIADEIMRIEADEMEKDGLINGVSNDEHAKRILNLLRQFPSF